MNIDAINIIRQAEGLLPIDGESCDSYPDFNEWQKHLDADPNYIKKHEAALDKELGVNRLF